MTFEVEQKLDESSQYTVETKLLEYKPEPKKMLELYSSGPSPETLRMLSELMVELNNAVLISHTGIGIDWGAALGAGVPKSILVSTTVSAAVSRAQQIEWDRRVEVEARRIFTEALALIHDKENWCVDKSAGGCSWGLRWQASKARTRRCPRMRHSTLTSLIRRSGCRGRSRRSTSSI